MHLIFREHFFKHHRKLEIGFVIFYNLEALFKIFCLSFRGYITRWVRSLSKLSNIFKALPSWKKLDFSEPFTSLNFSSAWWQAYMFCLECFWLLSPSFRYFLKQTDMDKEQEMNIALFFCDQLSTDRQLEYIYIDRISRKEKVTETSFISLFIRVARWSHQKMYHHKFY